MIFRESIPACSSDSTVNRLAAIQTSAACGSLSRRSRYQLGKAKFEIVAAHSGCRSASAESNSIARVTCAVANSAIAVTPRRRAACRLSRQLPWNPQ